MPVRVEERGKSDIDDAQNDDKSVELVVLRSEKVELSAEAKQLDRKLKSKAECEEDVAVLEVLGEGFVRRRGLVAGQDSDVRNDNHVHEGSEERMLLEAPAQIVEPERLASLVNAPHLLGFEENLRQHRFTNLNNELLA